MKRLLTTPQVEYKTGRKRSWIYKQVRNKIFPQPVDPGLWLESEVDAYIDDLTAKRDAQVASR